LPQPLEQISSGFPRPISGEDKPSVAIAEGLLNVHISPQETKPMRITQTRLSIDTAPREIKEITTEVADWVTAQDVRLGLLTVYLQHTSASLLIQENASPDVLRDLDTFLRRLVPEDVALYRHNDEGPDDMPAHIKSALTQVQLTIPVADGRLQLGVWQGIFLLEHRGSPHRRSLVLTLVGE
jgi:secondary thiamine-phosphate synthase enzyme